MNETAAKAPARQLLFDRLRAPLALLAVAVCAAGVYYFFFEKRSTDYYTNRDARMIGRAAQQIQSSLRDTRTIVANLVGTGDKFKKLYGFDRNVPAERRFPSAMFTTIETGTDGIDTHETRQYKRTAQGVELIFTAGDPNKQWAQATMSLWQFLRPIVRQTDGVFDSFLIIDGSGDVLYQSKRAETDDDSTAELKIVRLQELTVERLFSNPEKVKIEALLTASRHTTIRVGDDRFEMFSVPMHPGILEQSEGGKTVGAGKANPPETWLVCGLVSSAEFRAHSLAMSVTLLCCLGGALLLTILSWPFLKIALMNAEHKLALVDVILLGVSGILIVSVLCLAVLDCFTYWHVEDEADGQLARLSDLIATNFQGEIMCATEALDALQPWAERQISNGVTGENGGLLATDAPIEEPSFQSFALIDRSGRQGVKWFVENQATPLVNVGRRTYFSAPMNRGREYRRYAHRPVTVDSVRSVTTGEPELTISRRTDEMNDAPQYREIRYKYPVIAMAFPAALSVINPVMPEGFGFAIIDKNGMVMLHSESERNTIENFFAETDNDRHLRSLVSAHQEETLSLRYLGEDHRAHVQPLEGLPWTLVTFRDQHGLRAMNAEALMLTLYFLLMLYIVGLLLFVGGVLLLRPRYRAEWIWPDAVRVGDYRELAAAYAALLAAAAFVVAAASETLLLQFPLAFVPLVLVITYLYVHRSHKKATSQESADRDAVLVRRGIFAAIAAVLTAILLVWTWKGTESVVPRMATMLLLLLVAARAALRAPSIASDTGARERHVLPFAYLVVASLLLLTVSAVPTVIFFKAAYRVEMTSYVKWVQMKFARDLEERWWRVSNEFSNERGVGKENHLDARWENRSDLLATAAYGTDVIFDPAKVPDALKEAQREKAVDAGVMTIPPLLEAILPHYSEASVNMRELVHDETSGKMWEWHRTEEHITLLMRNLERHLQFTIISKMPQAPPSIGFTAEAAVLAGMLLALMAVAFALARFIALRVFLLDVLPPLWLSRGSTGLHRVICYPCDDESPKRLEGMPGFMHIDLYDPAHIDLLRNAPQSFPHDARTVFVDHLDYAFASGEHVEIVRAALDRLMRNPDRTIVIRPMAMSVITNGLYLRDDGDAWRKILSTYEYVDISDIEVDPVPREIRRSGAFQIPPPPPPAANARRRPWSFVAFDDGPAVVRNTIEKEVSPDPYLRKLAAGLEARATGRDQVLDEIGERAEEYYRTLWETCSPDEQVVLVQLAKTGLVNGKMRRDVRRLLARRLLQRTPQLRLMNETFRRFVLTQFDGSEELAKQIEEDLGAVLGRLRLPFMVGVSLVLLFLFVTQHELFEATFAAVTGIVATLPSLLRMLSGFGGQGGQKA